MSENELHEPLLSFSDEAKHDLGREKPGIGSAELPKKQKRWNKKIILKNSNDARAAKRVSAGSAARLRLDQPGEKLAGFRLIHTAAAAATAAADSGQQQVDEDNAGIKAGGLAQKTAEAAIRFGPRARRAQKLGNRRGSAGIAPKTIRTHSSRPHLAKTSDRPGLASSPISRWQQKRAIRKTYAAAKTGRNTAKTKSAAALVKSGEATAARTFKRMIRLIFLHKKGLLVALLIALALLLIFTVFASCSQLALGGLSAIVTSASFPAADLEITAAEMELTRLEAELSIKIKAIEETWPGYDEYRYALDPIGHDPFALIAYLATRFGAFSLADVIDDIQLLFFELYDLSLSAVSETRYLTGSDGEAILKEVSILDVRLSSQPLQDLITSRLSDDELRLYTFYLNSIQSKIYFGSPFAFAWEDRITSRYGWRVHPVDQNLRIHRGLDIAASTGTPILAIHDGIASLVRHSDTGFGNYIVIEDADGYRSVYAHCQTIQAVQGQTVMRGELIATAGSTGTSTGSHLHLEISHNGSYLNPIFFIAGSPAYVNSD